MNKLFESNVNGIIWDLPAFLAIFRRKEAVVMQQSVFNTDVYGGKQFVLDTLILKIVDKGYANSRCIGNMCNDLLNICLA